MNLYFRDNDCFIRVPMSDIKYMEADSNYTRVWTVNKQYIFSRTLMSIEEEILPLDKCRSFIRIHRSYIINRDYVDKIYGNMLCIGDKEFMVAKSQRETVFPLFKFLG